MSVLERLLARWGLWILHVFFGAPRYTPEELEALIIESIGWGHPDLEADT
jgi:hypothetical protein